MTGDAVIARTDSDSERRQLTIERRSVTAESKRAECDFRVAVASLWPSGCRCRARGFSDDCGGRAATKCRHAPTLEHGGAKVPAGSATLRIGPETSFRVATASACQPSHRRDRYPEQTNQAATEPSY